MGNISVRQEKFTKLHWDWIISNFSECLSVEDGTFYDGDILHINCFDDKEEDEEILFKICRLDYFTLTHEIWGYLSGGEGDTTGILLAGFKHMFKAQSPLYIDLSYAHTYRRVVPSDYPLYVGWSYHSSLYKGLFK